MSEREFQQELNDELLSAYIDGELAPEERAAVDARLADDPAARKLLHQLRSVSQDVQSLPLQSVGRDLTQEILRRAEAIKPAASKTPADSTTTKPTSAIPNLTIFQTRRSWVWASLALAAGLLIMVLQPNNDARNPIADVARHDGVTTESSRKLEESPANIANEPASTIAVDPSQIAKNDFSTPAPMMSPASPASPEGSIAGTPQPTLTERSPAPSDIATLDRIATNGQVAATPAMPAAEPQSPPASASSTDTASDVRLFASRIGGPGQASPPPGKVANEVPLATSSPAPASPLPSVGGGGGQEIGSGRFAGGQADELGQTPTEAPGSPKLAVAVNEALKTVIDGRLEKEAEPRPQVIVHVLTKPESFQRKSFEQLLANHGVVMEAEHDAAKDESGRSNFGREAKHNE